MDDPQLLALYRDLGSRCRDEDAIQLAVWRTVQRQPRNPTAFARKVLWRLRLTQARDAERFSELKKAWRRTMWKRTTPAQALGRAEAREALGKVDPRLWRDELGIVELPKYTRCRLKKGVKP